jgi:hypothetical protein
MTMTRFPPDIIDAVDTALSRFYGKDRIVDPALAEAVAELVQGERERANGFLRRSHIAQGGLDAAKATLGYAEQFMGRNKSLSDNTKLMMLWDYIKKAKGQIERRNEAIAKAIRGKP